MSFSEFVQALGTYCMFDTAGVLKFCFYIFDKDKNGSIERDELGAHDCVDLHCLVHPPIYSNSLDMCADDLVDILHQNNLVRC